MTTARLESRSLIPLQHSLIARLNSLLSRKSSLLGCLGNWPRKHLRSLTFSGTEVSRSSRIERNSRYSGENGDQTFPVAGGTGYKSPRCARSGLKYR
jgi:hypothetical protein